MAWHIQYQGEMGDPNVPVHNLDGAETAASQVAALHAAGAHVICYLNAGASETFRDDYSSLPDSVQGAPLDDWPGEAWLDVRQLDVLLPIMASRMDECAEKGFDAVDPDNLNGFAEDTGFPLTKADALAYQRALIGLAHERGLGIGLKNTMELIPELANEIDFAVNEQCQEYQECGAYEPLLVLGKPVFNVEYEGTCENQPEGVSTVLADLPLDGPTTSCR
ncbi:MAG: endo alpha-1,4 polygalactosaminidase [Propionibacteriaceae bacterium]|nr:endo alpha-1,4 polygalactosaminidase [Propionibacteriaceae bacterium]